MSDDWKKKPEYKSAAEGVDKEVGKQVAPITSAQNMLAHMPFFGGGVRVNLVGSTNFEGHSLNDMIDLVEHANPEHLELTGKSLFDAGKAIRKAAKDLEQHLKVDWEGTGADSFHEWTQLLIGYTHGLAGYADQAGTHLSVAATGLASARAAMPPRDTRPAHEQKLPTELPKAKQVDSNPDYAAAVKVEAHRQEAINQMNRLASYYKVAATDLNKQQEPTPLKPITNVGVPAPPPSWGGSDKTLRRYGSGSPQPVATAHGDSTEGHAGTVTPRVVDTHGHVPPLREVHEPSAPSVPDVGTEINSTTAVPQQVPASPPSAPAPTLPTTSGGGQLPVPPTGPMTPPITPTSDRIPGYGPAGRPPVTAQGRTMGTGGGRGPQATAGQTGRTVSSGRVPQGPTGQAARAMGRANPAGEPGARGAVQSGRSPMGQSVTGGTPRATNTSGGRSGTTGPIGQARNGVVGGKPIAGRTSGGAANPRVQRGMVIGAEEPASSTPTKGGIGQRGVVGAPAGKAAPGAGQAPRRSANNPEGVIGAARSSAKGPESGGAGLGRGAVGGRDGGAAEKEQRRSSRKRRDAPQTSD
ncbi:hypothetical protein [Streptomyces sp. NPDC040750]|uniref:hypothetical protein n=1 Tax=Streptomyces sp. NPDC040750 TaxID=3154491 RepID=UPI0033F98C74